MSPANAHQHADAGTLAAATLALPAVDTTIEALTYRLEALTIELSVGYMARAARRRRRAR